jgi:hypothetical protein
MKQLSKQNEITKLAHEKGYKVSVCGSFVSGVRCTNLKLSTQNKRGKLYTSFNIGYGGMSTRCYVHKLQAFQKFGEDMFKEGIVVRHMNDISLDNSHSNIEIGTHLDNTMDRIANQNSEDNGDCPF